MAKLLQTGLAVLAIQLVEAVRNVQSVKALNEHGVHDKLPFKHRHLLNETETAEKVFLDYELIQSFIEQGENVEVFKKRLEHKKLKAQQRKSKSDSGTVPTENNLIQNKAKAGLEFLEVANDQEMALANQASYEKQIEGLQKKANFSDNPDSNAAIQAAISFLQANHDRRVNESASIGDSLDLGIYTYFYSDDSCNYQTAANLDEGQQFYRDLKNISAKLFVAKGQVQRQKGDQVEIEICTGGALMDGNLLNKTYEKDKLYVVNHEKDTIYNDIVQFPQEDKTSTLQNFDSYSKDDSTIIVRGSDGEIIKKKGEDSFIGQSLAYLYNDFESQGILQQETYGQVYAPTDEQL